MIDFLTLPVLDSQIKDRKYLRPNHTHCFKGQTGEN